jgi:predicted nucleic acid-binding protein
LADPLVLVDTSVFIWLIRGRPERAAKWAQHVEGKRIVLSFATVAELWAGAYLRKYNEDSRRRLEAEIGQTRVIASNWELADEWARLTVEARSLGHALGQRAQHHDAWVAATARLYKLPLLTDDGHFEGFPGLNLIAVA